jgi:ATP-dependent DNA helicase Q5
LIEFFFQLFLSYLIRFKKLSYIVVDETHCENQWIYGQKNNEYYALGKLRKECRDIPWIVVTAIAGVDVDNKILIIINGTC